MDVDKRYRDIKRGSMRNGRKMARAKMGAGPPTPLGGTIGVL